MGVPGERGGPFRKRTPLRAWLLGLVTSAIAVSVLLYPTPCTQSYEGVQRQGGGGGGSAGRRSTSARSDAFSHGLATFDTYALEYKAFHLEAQPLAECLPGDSLEGIVSSLTHALQACLRHDWCGHVFFQPAFGHARLCAAVAAPPHAAKATELSGEGHTIAAHRRGCDRAVTDPANTTSGPPFALSVGCKTVDVHGMCQCGPGLHTINAKPGSLSCNLVVCSPCPSGFCDVLPHSQVAPGFNEPLQAHAVREHFGATRFRAINPALFVHSGKLYTASRMTNAISCPLQVNATLTRTGPYKKYLSDVGICELVGSPPALSLKSCITVNASGILPGAFPPLFTPRPDFEPTSVEDARPVSFNGSVYFTGTGIGKLNDTDVRLMMFFKLNPSLRVPVKGVVVLNCSAEMGLDQKNWQPLVTDTELLYVTRTFPLTIVRLRLVDGGCSIYQQSDVPSEAYLGRSYAARGMHGQMVSGGSNYLRIGDDEWLGVVHTWDWALEGLDHVYTHYFVKLRQTPNKLFTVAWVSEPWRLPHTDGLVNSLLDRDKHAGTQFVVGIARRDSDLYVSYGDMDCMAELAFVPRFFERLPDYVAGRLPLNLDPGDLCRAGFACETAT